jgi:hypothetical protein
MPFLALTPLTETLSLLAQLGSMILAALIGRFAMKSRAEIMVISFLGAAGAMLAHMLVDGQGAFLFVFYVPVIYLFAILGRRDLRR